MKRVLLLSVALVAAGLTGCSGGDCSGDFCVQVLSSAYRIDRCSADAGENCTFAEVYFTAADKGQPTVPASELSASMTVNERAVGVEGGSELREGESALAVQVLMDRSFSITESGSTEAVRSAVKGFIDALPAAAQIRIAEFASEGNVPTYIGANCETNDASFLDREGAKKIVTDCYAPYSSATSSSQTQLYDAVGQLLPGPKASPNVVVIFTDGADTASTAFKTPQDARQSVLDRSRSTRLYAIGLGAEPNEDALNTLTDHRFFRASDKSQLDQAFASVSSELKSVLSFRALVATQEAQPQGHLKVTHNGKTVEKYFTIGE